MQEYIDITDKILRELCVIPAPSHYEDKRVEYCLNKLHSFGINAYSDEAKNVICEFKCDGTDDTVIFAAHTDVVFPDTEPLPMSEDEEKLYCPGCGDDTIAVACLISELKRLKDQNKKPLKNVVVVLDSCEEGLGNGKGIRAIMEKFGRNTTEFFTFDGNYTGVVNRSVGSHRYKVTVKTRGGHSYGDFGNENAARVLAEGIQKIYAIPLPDMEGKTTYNVGVISGGTTVTSIAQEAYMLCEYRSDNAAALEYMRDRFYEAFEFMRRFAEVEIELVGNRPCMGDVDRSALQRLTDFCIAVQEKHSGVKVGVYSGSTDCNIPHSMGIPAVCVGNHRSGDTHCRTEWLYKSSIPIGFKIVCDIVENYFE